MGKISSDKVIASDQILTDKQKENIKNYLVDNNYISANN